MRKLLILLCCMGLMCSVEAQEKEAPASVDVLTKKLEKVNHTLSKKLDKINGKLQKKLLKLYPQLEGVNIDSLIDNRLNGQALASSEPLTKLDSVQGPGQTINPDGLVPLKVDSLHLNDSTLQVIRDLKESLMADLSATPPNMEIHKELTETVTKLDKLQELYKQAKLPAIPEMPELRIPSLETPDMNKLLPGRDFDKLKSQASELGGLLEEYKKEFDGWEEALIARVSSLEEIKLMQEQKERMAGYKPLPEGYRENLDGFQTNDFVKEKLQAKAEELNQVGAKSLQEKFDEAQARVTEAKEKFPSLESLEDAPKRPPNPYADDPFLKRLKLGFNFQANRREPASVDLSLRLSYLLNKNARAGIGTAYRIGLEEDFGGVNFDDQVFGLKTFFDYTIFRSIYAEALYEWNNTPVPAQADAAVNKQWVQSGMLGLGNRFVIRKKLKGNFTALYNFLHDEKSPNPSPWVFRFGFEF